MDSHREGLDLHLRYTAAAPCKTPSGETTNFFEALRHLPESGVEHKELVSVLKSLKPYPHLLALSAEMNVQHPFDLQVVTSYWTGHPHLNVERFHNLATLLPLVSASIDDPRFKQKDFCLIHAASIIDANPNYLVVSYNPMVVEKGELRLGTPTTRRVTTDLLRGENLQSGFVSMHYSWAISKLSAQEYATLQQSTLDALKHFNALRRAS